MKTKVVVLLSTYNGEKYLQEQIGSVLNQKDVNVLLLIRDDDSSDHSVEIIKKYQILFPSKIKLIEGKKIGCTKSFVELMRIAVKVDEYNADYYAFCDQDDVWLPDKLSRSVSALSAMDTSFPLLYFGNPTSTDSSLHFVQIPPPKKFKFSLGEALIRNASGGNTQVFNRILLEEASKVDFCPYILHDWWLYSVCIALSGKIYYDSSPLLLYRLHQSNVVGGKKKSLYKKCVSFFSDSLGMSYQLAVALYNGYKDELTEKNKRLLRLVVEYKKSMIGKIRLLAAYRLFYTYNRKTNIRFMLSVLLGKF